MSYVQKYIYKIFISLPNVKRIVKVNLTFFFKISINVVFYFGTIDFRLRVW